MNIVGLIPARGGSKSIPHKNIAPLLGKPLISYTCDSALSSSKLSRVIVSTDDLTIADVAKECGAEVPFIRPNELSQDDTPTLPVIQHAVQWLLDNENYNTDAVMILQPTSPLRKAEHIDEAINIMERTNADTVVSVTEVPHRFNPVSLMKLDRDGNALPYAEGPMTLRRQDKPVVYARNGPVVLLVDAETLMGQNALYGDKVRPYLMNERDSYDIDTLDDLELVEVVLSYSRSKAGASD